MAVDGGGLTLVGYVRVSFVGKRRGPRFFSPVLQREEIEAWAARVGARLVEVFVELDESGTRPDRPLLEAAIGRIEARAADGLVVWQVDRFARSLIDGLVLIERVRAAGGRFFSVRDGLDTDTDTGRMVLRVLLSKAEWDLERIRAAWDVSHARAVARGAYPMAYTPVGYRRTSSGRLRPHPDTAPIVTELFARRAGGQSIDSLGRWLETERVLTAKGNPGWTNSTLGSMLGRRVYLGEVVWGQYFRARAHPALTDPATWELAQRPLRQVAARSVRYRDIAPALLSFGLTRCASCSMSLGVTRRRRGGQPVIDYCCRGQSAAGPCPAPASMTGAWLEPYVETATLELLRRRRRSPTAALRNAEAAADTADRALARYRDSDAIRRTLGDRRYLEGLRVRADQVSDARLAVATARARCAAHALPRAGELEARWASLDVNAKRDVIAKVIDCVFVAPGRVAPDQRITVCPTGTAPARLPHGGDRASRARPFVLGARARRAIPQGGFLWPQARVDAELAALLRGRRRWPTAREFASADRMRLHQQVVLGRGEHWWALRFGLPIRKGAVARAPWTPERVSAALALYLADKPEWPTVAQFRADGMNALYAAASASGGIPYWRERHRRQSDAAWSDERIGRELRRLCQRRATFPTRRDFAEQPRLYRAVISGEGVRRWARELGLPLDPRSRPHAPGAPQRRRGPRRAP